MAYTVESGIEIKCGIEAVFALVSDPRRDPEWREAVSFTEQILGDGPGLGASYRFAKDYGTGVMPGKRTITHYEPPRRIAFHTLDPMRDWTTAYTLEPTRQGRGTHFHRVEHIRFRGVYRTIARLARKRIELHAKSQNEALARLLGPRAVGPADA